MKITLKKLLLCLQPLFQSRFSIVTTLALGILSFSGLLFVLFLTAPPIDLNIYGHQGGLLSEAVLLRAGRDAPEDFYKRENVDIQRVAKVLIPRIERQINELQGTLEVLEKSGSHKNPVESTEHLLWGKQILARFVKTKQQIESIKAAGWVAVDALDTHEKLELVLAVEQFDRQESFFQTGRLLSAICTHPAYALREVGVFLPISMMAENVRALIKG